MGVDLSLLPVDIKTADWWASHQILGCERRRELWDAIKALRMYPVIETFRSYLAHRENGERWYGPMTKDPYGSHLGWVTAADLCTLSEHEGVRDNYQNRAIWAYLKELPPAHRIVLYWH